MIDKGIADATLSDKWDHIISPGTRYFTCHYLKTFRSINISHKKIEILNLLVYIAPDETQDMCMEINDDVTECRYLKRFDSEIKTVRLSLTRTDLLMFFFLLIFVDI